MENEGIRTFLAGAATGIVLVSMSLEVPDILKELDRDSSYFKNDRPRYEKRNKENIESIWEGKEVKGPYDLLEAYIEEAGRDRLQGIMIANLDSAYQLDLGLPHVYNAFYERKEIAEEKIAYLIEKMGGESYTIYSNDFQVEIEGNNVDIVESSASGTVEKDLQEVVRDYSFPAKEFLESLEIPYQIDGDRIRIDGEPQDFLSSQEAVDIVRSLPHDTIFESSRSFEDTDYSVFFGEEGFGYQIKSYKLGREDFEKATEDLDSLVLEKGLRGDFEPSSYLPKLLILSQDHRV